MLRAASLGTRQRLHGFAFDVGEDCGMTSSNRAPPRFAHVNDREADSICAPDQRTTQQKPASKANFETGWRSFRKCGVDTGNDALFN
jgi:hypothetical protein